MVGILIIAHGTLGESLIHCATHVLGRGVGRVGLSVVNSTLIPENHLYTIAFHASRPESIHASRYTLSDSTAGTACFANGRDFDATGLGSVGCGLLPLVSSIPQVRVNTALSGFAPGSPTNEVLSVSYGPVPPIALRRKGFPDDITIVFADTVVDTSTANGTLFPARPAKFRAFAHADTGDVQLDFRFVDSTSTTAGNFDGTLSAIGEQINIICPSPGASVGASLTWTLRIDGQATPTPIRPPRQGDVYRLILDRPLGEGDVFTFTTHGARIDPAAARAGFATTPYVVPNPYVESASFEPARFNVTGRGERRMEFRGLPSSCTIRIYTVRGDLVQTLRHDSSLDGFTPWDLRTKDNLEVAPGLYIFHVDAPGIGTHVGKFAIIK